MKISLSPSAPYTTDGNAAGCLVTMRSGDQLCLEASVEDVQREFERIGFLDILPDAVSKLLLDSEVTILESKLARGFRYAAKDANGATFAYTEPPIKGTVSWINDDNEPGVERIIGGIDMLSFDDEYPLDIAVALGLEDE